MNRPREPGSHWFVAAYLNIFLILPAWAGDRSEIGSPRLMQGPMVGAVTDTTIPIWVRASGPFPCAIQYDTVWPFVDAQRTETIQATKENDYCTVLSLEGLEPATTYFYRVLVNDEGAKNLNSLPAFEVKTALPADRPTSFRVCFGSCPQYRTDPIQPIWDAVEGLEPDLFFWLGDNIYGDALDPDILAEEYRRQRDVVKLVPLLRTIPQLAIWDDHDFGLNDHDRTHPGKEGALRMFKRYWPNPSYGLSDTPGVFFKYDYGGVDFFFLDVRYHRDPNDTPDGPEKTHLGKEQLQWLKDRLKESRAVFKVLIAGGEWAKPYTPGRDSWASFHHERNHLFDFIRDKKIGGVILLAGNSHVGELNCSPQSEQGGYDLYELVSSPLAQEPGVYNILSDAEVRIRQVYAKTSNAGILDFNLAAEDPSVRINLIDIYGRLVWKDLVLEASELKNGVKTYHDKQSSKAAKVQEFVRGAHRQALMKE
jgi:alkaline phosphatase D